MSKPTFLQVHTLTSYPASLLNRDDAGFAKRMPFGGVTRTRVSSQCLKRHWRVFEGESSLQDVGVPLSVRSRQSFEEFIVKPLAAKGLDQKIVRAATEKLVAVLLGSEAKAKKAGKKQGLDPDGETVEEAVKTAQVTVLGRPELDYLASLVSDACTDTSDKDAACNALATRLKDRELRKNIDALLPGKLEAGLGAALFGRMVTGDILSRSDAALHVAHSMTVHAQQSESDYFSAIDDLAREEGEAGSGHINAAELTSGVFYGYVVVDLRQLAENLGNNAELAKAITERLIKIIATVSPGAKLGSTAPYAFSHAVLAESGRSQPRTLANAFLEPIRAQGDIASYACRSLADYMSRVDAMYGCRAERVVASLEPEPVFGDAAKPMSLSELATWAGGEAERALL